MAAAFSPDGTRAVTTDPRTLVVWDPAHGEAMAFWTTPAAVLDVAVAAILAVGFSGSPSTFYALAGDSRLVELRRS